MNESSTQIVLNAKLPLRFLLERGPGQYRCMASLRINESMDIGIRNTTHGKDADTISGELRFLVPFYVHISDTDLDNVET